MVAPTRQVETTEYDGEGHVTKVTDANLHVVASAYDGAGRKVEETQGSGTAEASTTRFKYDSAGNLVEVKSARVTGVAYDVRETFDDLNRAVRTEDALGNVTTRAFDAVGGLVCEKRPLGNAAGSSWSSPLVHGGARGLSLAEVETQGCGGGYVTRYEYEEAGKLVRLTDASGAQTSYVYVLTAELTS